jgi:hypothetical protein
MSGPDNFLSRWARRKSEAEAASSAGSSVAPPPEPEVKAEPNPDVANAGQESLDWDSLPSVESITETTDIRGFLRSGVAADLTRSALRQAWASDPAIRDFIGIAENQWDFNDPSSIPGFDLMNGTDDVPALLAQAIGQVEKIGEAIPDLVSHPQPEPAGQVASAHELPKPTSDGIVASANADVGAVSEAVAVQNSVTAVDEESRPDHRRRHGSALPR